MRSGTARRLAPAFGAIVVAALAASATPAFAQAKKTIKAVMHSGLRITDPIITTAYIARNHGYMIYDVLFAYDEKFEVKPQMAKEWSVSDDKLTYTFTLRDGLKFHDGTPVTSDDCIASIQRWAKRDGMGQKLADFTKEWVKVDDKTFKLVLKEPYGLVMTSLGKPSGNTPFIMPKRMADTPADKNVPEEIGSGPFKFVKEEFQPGLKVVYEKNTDYVPRSEPVSYMAGGKLAKVDRVEWINIPDYQTAINALINGEIDYIEQPPHDFLPIIKKNKDITLTEYDKLGLSGMLRMNWTLPPFDNVKVRQAVMLAVNQQDYLDAQIGDPDYYQLCPAYFICGSPNATDAGFPKPDLEKAKALLKEGGYDGKPIVIMQPTDLAIVAPLAPVTAQALRKIGMNVDLQSMDWQTLVGRRAKQDPVAQGGWNIFHTTWVNVDMINPIANIGMNAKGKVGGWFGWPDVPEIEKLRDAYARELDPAKQKQIAADVQKLAFELGMYYPTGMYRSPIASKGLTGIVHGAAPVFWNIEKK
ncbi:ABC transporter substrate-binding protein [Enterovirga rhinocerotis]|uniref:Peptide/nickel transport system substrate-binding protein n=1 Tax=Enterovirga rhinocerotis TaxID=1339210 RepID=A0A4R7BVR9_9HYPH|nr:ABC transporter substrate-binding protein [Enterovirga rhinocerotis]TDR89192.1 peptide/nickel transport system substrate-binding protein [Enterovirga rhinocerotis]